MPHRACRWLAGLRTLARTRVRPRISRGRLSSSPCSGRAPPAVGMAAAITPVVRQSRGGIPMRNFLSRFVLRSTIRRRPPCRQPLTYAWGLAPTYAIFSVPGPARGPASFPDEDRSSRSAAILGDNTIQQIRFRPEISTIKPLDRSPTGRLPPPSFAECRDGRRAQRLTVAVLSAFSRSWAASASRTRESCVGRRRGSALLVLSERTGRTTFGPIPPCGRTLASTESEP